MHPEATVIVPVRDGVDLLRACLQALAVQDHPSYEVIVVDNGSRESVATAMPDDRRFTLLREPQRGSYAARNRGLAEAQGDVLAFTDADCTPAPDWLSRAAGALQGPPGADMVGGAVRLRFPTGEPRTGPELFEARHGSPQDRYLADQRFAVTANMVTWRKTFDLVGTFDAALMSRGDAEWGKRVHAAGLVQRYVPEAVVVHPARSHWSELLGKTARVTRGRIAVDLTAGRDSRHFFGLAASQLRSVVRAVLSTGPAGEATTPSRRVRYLGALAASRTLSAALYGTAGARAMSRKSSLR